MKFSTHLALAAAALAYKADAQVIPGEFIAVGKAGACATLLNDVQAFATTAPVKTIKIGSSCFVPFSGNADSQLAVSEIDGVFVEPNQVVTALAPKSWGLDRIDQEDLPLDNADFGAAYDGSDQTVYILDTGINKDHEDFGGRATYGGDFINEADPTDGNGHGSHCAGTAVGSTFGIARNAAVVGVKVLSAAGSGTYAGVISGMEWATADAGARPSVMSMSLGGGSSAAVDAAANAMADAGHIVVVAAGNSAADACNYSPAGAGGNGPTGTTITVGSTDISDSMSSFSNYGTCTDIFAPGRSITSVWKGASDSTRTISGTSMACPHVAGVAAVLLQKHNGNKDAAVAELFASAAVDKISSIGADSDNLLLQVPTSAPPADSDPTCAFGIARGKYCCHSDCGTCGGPGCGSRPGKGTNCCSGVIRDAGKSCDDNVAPCLITL